MYRPVAHLLLSVRCGVRVVMDVTGGWGLFAVQENLKRLRDSITRRHKERQKPGEELGWLFLMCFFLCKWQILSSFFFFILIYFYLLSDFRLVTNCLICCLKDYEISAPLQRSLFWGSSVTQECAVYEPSPRLTHAPPQAAPQVIQRGTWKTGSTSSTSSKPPFTFGSGSAFKTKEIQISAYSLGRFIFNWFELHLFGALFGAFACSLRIFWLFAVHLFYFIRAVTGPFFPLFI